MDEIQKYLSEIFLLPPSLKKQLKTAIAKMPVDRQKKATVFIGEIIEKQNQLIAYLAKNDPDFLAKLKHFADSAKMKIVKDIENKHKIQESLKLDELESKLNNL